VDTSPSDARFSGSIAELYERLLVPMIFQPFADDLVARIAALPGKRVLELAAGTGVVTRGLASHLPPDASIVATDLNAPMLELAAQVGTARPVTWQQADAMRLPFEDSSVDTVACQFGVMFFPDKARAFAEARRVLRPGGTLIFNTWDRLEANTFPDIVTRTLAMVFPDDPPRFLARVPHGYPDPNVIARDLAAAGFTRPPRIATVAARSRADTPRQAATAFCMGTPLRNEIDMRGHGQLEAAVHATAEALAMGSDAGAIEGAIEGNLQAHAVAVVR
jgi:SAM-dependent methyltransferase